jgi:hypothetical protein
MTDRFNDPHFSTDVSREVAMLEATDFRPTTLLEQSQMGADRVNKPVGAPSMPAAEFQTTGGARLGDTEAAYRLGANGRKK